MKYVDEFRDCDHAETLAGTIKRIVTRPWTIMEVCGGQTHSIVKFGLDELLPEMVTLVHGPGCPVCVTPTALIDHAVVLVIMRNHAVARKASLVGEAGSRGVSPVVLKTVLGTHRILDLLSGEQLPRIC